MLLSAALKCCTMMLTQIMVLLHGHSYHITCTVRIGKIVYNTYTIYRENTCYTAIDTPGYRPEDKTYKYVENCDPTCVYILVATYV